VSPDGRGYGRLIHTTQPVLHRPIGITRIAQGHDPSRSKRSTGMSVHRASDVRMARNSSAHAVRAEGGGGDATVPMPHTGAGSGMRRCLVTRTAPHGVEAAHG
jgi:hypothetical protein